MAQLTWLGEDDLHGGGAGPSFTTAFGGIKFPKGEPVEVRMHAFVQRALNNQFFEVSDPDDVDDAPEKKNKGGRPRKDEAVSAGQMAAWSNPLQTGQAAQYIPPPPPEA